MPGCSKSAWAAASMRSTSSIRAVAVVVSIGLDHQEFLGSTLEAIAREKAGIFRRGVPAVLGSRDMPPCSNASRALIGAPLKRLGREYDFTRASGPLEIPRAALGPIGPAAAGAARRDAVPQCRRPPSRLSRSSHPRLERGGRGGWRVGSRRSRLIGALSGDRGRARPDLDPGCGPQSRCGGGARAAICARCRAPGRTLAVCGILADKDAAGVAAAARAIASTSGGSPRPRAPAAQRRGIGGARLRRARGAGSIASARTSLRHAPRAAAAARPAIAS